MWATLADGTPLVTAAKQGQGFIVLFHVTANSDWSNLPLSGLFVEMLRRVVTLGPSRVGTETGRDDRRRSLAAARPMSPRARCRRLQTLDGFGQLIPPPLRAAPIAPDKLDTHGARSRPSTRLLRAVGRRPGLQPHHRQDRAQAARHDRGFERGQRLRHEEARGARAVALSRGHCAVRRRHSRHAGAERRLALPPSGRWPRASSSSLPRRF